MQHPPTCLPACLSARACIGVYVCVTQQFCPAVIYAMSCVCPTALSEGAGHGSIGFKRDPTALQWSTAPRTGDTLIRLWLKAPHTTTVLQVASLCKVIVTSRSNCCSTSTYQQAQHVTYSAPKMHFVLESLHKVSASSLAGNAAACSSNVCSTYLQSSVRTHLRTAQDMKHYKTALATVQCFWSDAWAQSHRHPVNS